MFFKNKILDKIVQIYICIFFLFSFIATDILIVKIFAHFGICNGFIDSIALIITIFSYGGLAIFFYKDMNNQSD